MRSQLTSTDQNSGKSEQKKSVFDRLGRQLDTGRKMKRRPSPGQHGSGEYMPPPPPPMHDVDYARYGRDPHSAQAEMEWRYQQERRHMQSFARGDRGHPMHLAPPPPQPPPPGHYEMEMERGQGPYYPPHPHPYHNVPPGPHGPLPPGMGPGNMGPINLPPQRTSPKYDRHGNMIGFKGDRLMRMGPMEHHHAMSPSRNFMPGPMMGPMHPPHEMSPMSFPHQRWPDNMEPDFPPHPGNRLMPMDGGFNPMLDSRRYPNQPPPPPQQQQQQMMNPLPPLGHSGEFPRYTKWRERRDVITNLDRETAQSSSRTDSLKSTLQQAQQQDARNEPLNSNSSSNNKVKSSKLLQKSSANSESNEKSSKSKEKDKTKTVTKIDPQDISDGEIIDDEDSTDESEANDRSEAETHAILLGDDSYLNHRSNSSSMGPYRRSRDSHQYYEPVKKRRLHEPDDYSMDYETISDEDLDDFMEDKKLSPEEAKLAGRLGDGEHKSLSEIELLNALGLDWANLVEMARQSKSSNKESCAPGNALKRFSLSNYLPTLGISSSLVGPEIYELITRVCRV